ncbi:hypothetical protein [Evansella clarkii]|uniref:hypothetical protein n=1 Tax=Evansella clarkii TaxID=79879 RepID=UPI0009987D5C|nr:hypothetical protein [Evansella clarkii]
MFSFFLIFILLIISFSSFSAAEKAKRKRRGIKFIFSVSLAIMLPFFVEVTILIMSQFITGTTLFITLYALSIILFTALQLILYDIGLMSNY